MARVPLAPYSVWHLCLVLIAVFGVAVPNGSSHSATASLYCGHELVRQGDPIWRVGRRCPAPFWVEQRRPALAYDRFGQPLSYGSDSVEIWYLNFGERRLMRRLVFRNGTLERIISLGYGVGFEPGSRRCTAQELDRAGNTAAEVFARCGAPDYRYDFSELGPYYGGPWPPPSGSQRERWAYDTRPGRFVRELFFVDGRLIHRRVQDR